MRHVRAFATLFFLSSVGVVTARADSWAPITTTGAPSARAQHTAVWTGTRLLVWGGNDGNNTALGGAVAIYNPATNTWSSGSALGAPTARYDHTAVWTGSKMIVWGGNNGSNLVNSGGIYDPGTDSWSSITLTGAPEARAVHTAVWTGTKMIVWGGYTALSDLNSGGMYDPATNSWVATTTTGAPATREYHTAVWTGSRMVIYGGFSLDTFSTLNDVAQFDPSSGANGSWTPSSTTGAPGARSGHRAVWTGTKMLVWGGFDGANYLATGSEYTPGTGTWSAMTSTGAPSARATHSAVWADTQMVIFGGVDNSSAFNTGGRYTPGAPGSWTATTTTNAPSARSAHTAVWSGTEMLVHGGADGSFNSVATGGRYTPGGSGGFTYGDLNLSGTVDVFDVVILQGYIVGNVTQGVAPFTAPLGAANVKNDSSNIDVFDVVILAGFIVGNVTSLPVP